MIDELKRILSDRDALVEKTSEGECRFEEVAENFLIGYFPFINYLPLIINYQPLFRFVF